MLHTTNHDIGPGLPSSQTEKHSKRNRKAVDPGLKFKDGK